MKWGVEARLNRDTTYFGTSPNGEYDFGGGTVYSPMFIPSASGQHDVQPGDPLPDTLSSLLVGYPYGYTIAVAPPYFSNGAHIGPAAINRNDVNAYVQDTWKINEHWTLDYGLRYEVYTPITERAHRTSSFLNPFPPPGVAQEFLINPQPGYQSGWNGWGPRVQIDWNAPGHVRVHAGGAITVIPPNIWQDNFLTGSTPFSVYPRVNAAKNGEIAYGFQITPDELPPTYTPQGQNVFASGNTKDVPANTVMDVNRYQQDLAALAPGHQLSLLSLNAVDRRFGNGFLQTWTLGVERAFGGLTADAAYVGTESFRLPRISYPNAYPGADAGFAPFTDFNSSGTVTGGFGFESVITDTAHSSYNALQTSLAGQVGHGGPGLQAGYTWSKSLDDVSGILGGTGSAGAVVLFSPQNPFDTHAEKGPSNFDVTHAFTVSAAQNLHLDSLAISPFECASGDKRLGVAEHLDHHQWISLHGVFRNPANRLRNGRRRPPGSDRYTEPFHRPQLPRAAAKIISASARTTPASSPSPLGFPEAQDRTPAASERWAATPSADRPITTSTTRSSRPPPSATGGVVSNGPTFSSGQNSSTSSTSSTWGCPRTPSGVPALASSAKPPAPRGRSSFPSSSSIN